MDLTTPGTGTYTTISTHVPLDLAREISQLARSNERSSSGEIRLALRQHLRAARAAEPAAALRIVPQS